MVTSREEQDILDFFSVKFLTSTALLLPLSIILGIISMVLSPPISVALFALFVFSITMAQAYRMRVPLTWPLLIFITFLMVAIVDSHTGVLPYFPDATLYHNLGTQTSNILQSGALPALNIYPNLRVGTYSFIVGIIYALFGDAQLLQIIFNIGAWCGGIIYVYKLTEQINSKVSPFLIGLLSFSPAVLLYVPAILRDSLSFLIFVSLCYHATVFFDSKQYRHIPNILTSMVLLALLRPELIPAIIFAFSTVTLLENKNNIQKLLISAILIGTVFLLLFSATSVSLPNYLNPFRLELLEAKRAAEVTRPNAYLVNYSYNSWLDVFIQLPLRMFYFLFSPFPWEADNYRLFLATADATVSIFLVSLSIPSLYLKFRNNRTSGSLFLFITILLAVVGYSLVISTEGVTPRRRMYVVPLLIVFINDFFMTKYSTA